ncbi:MAG: hypothetical protein SOZ89_06315 [Peptoniphilaceae bacterium]|nr:hypothetical protein [Peptoniphilaceae bacterium]MDD7383547.1 hypothetical protein [Peptoniphilaceae bacterium]MDY3738720.1 hypothetical protein [Peptoniphilaceae bacterium]
MITINVELIGQTIITILSIVALVVLILLLKNISKFVSKLNKLIDENHTKVNDVVSKAPSIAEDAKRLISNVNDVVADPNVKLAISKVNDTMDNVSSISSDVKDTVDYFGKTAVDTADTLESGMNSIVDYAYMAKDVVEIIKDVMKK